MAVELKRNISNKLQIDYYNRNSQFDLMTSVMQLTY